MSAREALRRPYVVLARPSSPVRDRRGAEFPTVSYAMTAVSRPFAAVTRYRRGVRRPCGALALVVRPTGSGLNGSYRGTADPGVAGGGVVMPRGWGSLAAHPCTATLRGACRSNAVWRASTSADATGRGVRRRAHDSSLGMALGPAVGGWIFDTSGAIRDVPGSAATGARRGDGATFPPFASPVPQLKEAQA